MNKNAFIDYDNSLYIVGQLEPSCTSVKIMLHMKISLSIGTFKFAIITEIPHRLLHDKFLRKTNVLHHDYSSINFVLLITYFSMWNSKIWKKICLRVWIIKASNRGRGAPQCILTVGNISTAHYSDALHSRNVSTSSYR